MCTCVRVRGVVVVVVCVREMCACGGDVCVMRERCVCACVFGGGMCKRDVCVVVICRLDLVSDERRFMWRECDRRVVRAGSGCRFEVSVVLLLQ